MAEGMDKLHKQLEALAKSALAECRKAADEATKAYSDAVKATDGLTTVKPSVVKVLQGTAKSPDPDAIAKAIAELGKHKAELVKAHGKDKAKAKQIKAFDKGVDAAAKALSGLI